MPAGHAVAPLALLVVHGMLLDAASVPRPRERKGPTMPAAMLFFVLVVLLAGAPGARAACNLIPGTEKTFGSVLGAANRPFAAPGERLELRLRTCDASTGFLQNGSDHVVTLAFKSTSGDVRLLVLAADCSEVDLAPCSAAPGVVSATCRQVTAGDLVTRADLDEGDRRLVISFPDTDDLVAGAADDVTLSGPVAIGVTAAGAPPACGLATGTCTAQAGLIACVDQLFANDGDCGTAVANATFANFTALPPPNDYQADCFRESPPCTATATEVRAAVDGEGNLLIPMGWGGVLVADAGVPVPRLVRTRLASPLPFTVPGQVFLGSFTPEGGLLPPILEPQLDPTTLAPDVVTFFGSVDAPYTIIRVAKPARDVRRRQRGGRALCDPSRLQGRRVRHVVRRGAGARRARWTATARAARAAGSSTSPRSWPSGAPLVLPRSRAALLPARAARGLRRPRRLPGGG